MREKRGEIVGRYLAREVRPQTQRGAAVAAVRCLDTEAHNKREGGFLETPLMSQSHAAEMLFCNEEKHAFNECTGWQEWIKEEPNEY